MEKHIETDEVITMKEVKRIEKDINEHAEHLVRITNAGSDIGQTKRIKTNLKTINNI